MKARFRPNRYFFPVMLIGFATTAYLMPGSMEGPQSEFAVPLTVGLMFGVILAFCGDIEKE